MFDPNKPFKVIDSGFDPNKPFTKVDDISQGESALKGAQKGLLWGFSDESVGFIDSMLKASGGLFLPEGTENPYKDKEYGDVYTEGRDEERRALKRAEEANPKMFMGGEILGSLVAPGVGAVNKLSKGATGFKELAKAGAKMGAVEGGVYGVGDSEESTIGGLAKDAATDAALGTAFGGLLGGALGVVASKFGRNADEVADFTVPETVINRAEDSFKRGKPDSDKLFLQLEEEGPQALLEKTGSEEIANNRQTVRRYLQYLGTKVDNLDTNVFTKKKEKKLTSREEDFFGDIDHNQTKDMERTDWDTSGTAASEIDLDANVSDHQKYIDNLVGGYETLRKQGMVNKQTWDEFRLGESIMRQMDFDDMARKARATDGLSSSSPDYVKQKFKDYDMKDPLNPVTRHMFDANVAARTIDDKTGLDIEIIQNKLVDQVNKKKGFDREMANAMDQVQKVRKKSKLSDEEIYDALHTGGMKGSPVVNAYRAAFEGLREKAADAGITIEKRANYVPQRKKSGVDLILELQKQGKELDNAFKTNTDLGELTGRIDWEKADGDLLESLDKLKGKRKDLAYLQHIVQKLYNTSINTTDELKEAIKHLKTSEMVYRSSEPEIGAAFARQGEMPDWLREKNIDKLLWQSTDQVSHAAYVLPVARALDSRMVALQRLGLDNAAAWVKNYRMDISRINRPMKHRLDITSDAKNKMRFWGTENENKMLGRFARDVPDFMEVSASSLYPNIIGGNVKAIMRNLTQPLSMTAGEMGFWKGTPVALKAMGRLAKIKASGKWPEFRKQLVAEGTIPENVGLNDFEGVRSGVASWAKSKGVRTTQNAIDRYAKVAMYLYNNTDTINRAVTKIMAEDIGVELIKKGRSSEYFSKFPKAVQNKILRAETPKEAEDYVRRYLLVQTQLAYGQVGGNELGRTLGPGLTMLAKWPVAVTSDMIYKVQNKQFKQMMIKYFGPAVAASLLTGAIVDNDKGMTPRQQELIGKGGFPTWLPYGSAFGIADVTTPVNLKSLLDLGKSASTFGSKALGGSINERDMRKAKRAARRAVQQYVPIAGGVDRQANHLYRILMNEDMDKKKK